MPAGQLQAVMSTASSPDRVRSGPSQVSALSTKPVASSQRRYEQVGRLQPTCEWDSMRNI
jgi:hypothetical protein